MQTNDGAGSSASDGTRMDWATSAPSAASSGVNESWRRAQDALQSIGAPQQQTATAQSNPYAWGTPAYYPQAGYMQPASTYCVPAQFNPYAPPPAVSFQPQFPLQLPLTSSRPAPALRQPTHYPPPRPIPVQQPQQQSPLRPLGYPPRSRFPTRPNAPVRFVLAKDDAGGRSSFSQLNNGNAPLIPATYPPIVRDYVKRAYAALEREEDREKLESYIRQRIDPVIRSGAVNAVNWTTEPLPHELNFTIRTGGWIPASKIKEKFENAQQKVKQASRVEEPKPGMWAVENNNALGQSSGIVEQAASTELVEPNASYEVTSAHAGINALALASAHSLHGFQPPQPMFPKKQLKNSGNNKKKKVQKTAMSAALKPNSTSWSVVEPLERKDWRSKRFAAGVEKASRRRLSAQLRNEYLVGDFALLNRAPEDIVGTCMEVEKPFFRLTAAPDPSQVRPLRVLVRALEMVKVNYKANAEYRYASDQLKSIRQDLMIQCIRNEFTLLVYESNARIALENRDREEFNQCQNQLRLLYSEVDPSKAKNRWEFTAYRLLYFVSMKDTLDVSTLLHEMTADALQDECMRFALGVWEAWSMGNYLRLFKLYTEGPKMTGYVMDMFVERERRLFLSSILKAYRPGISVAVVAAWFGMSPRAMVDWLTEKDIQAEVGGTLDCRQYSNAKL